MRRQLKRALAQAANRRASSGMPGTVDTLTREIREAYAALPPEKGEHAPEDATLAERITALQGDVSRWRMAAEAARAQMRGEREAVDRHDWAAVAAGYPPHRAGARRDGCPGCAAMPPADVLSVPDGTMPAAADIPQSWVDALLDGLAVPGSGGITHDIGDHAARAAVVAVIRVYTGRG